MMVEMSEGKRVPAFIPRRGDLMRELFHAFNLLIDVCNARLETAAAQETRGQSPVDESPGTDGLEKDRNCAGSREEAVVLNGSSPSNSVHH
jgi:hypothetical protein